MTSDDERMVNVTIDALTKLMNLFRFERFFYLATATGGAGLALWAAALWISTGKPDATQIGLMFGATGTIATTGGLVSLYLKRGFDLVESVINRLAVGDAK